MRREGRVPFVARSRTFRELGIALSGVLALLGAAGCSQFDLAPLPRGPAAAPHVDGAEVAWMPDEHLEFTEGVLRRRRDVGPDDAERASIEFAWRSREALNVVSTANVAVDYVQVAQRHGCFEYVLSDECRRRMDAVKSMTKLMPGNGGGTDFFHFDNLFSYDQVLAHWDRLDAWAAERADEIEGRWETEGSDPFLVLLGIVTHAVQDFYCHSNYAFLAVRTIPTPRNSEIPAWFELRDRRVRDCDEFVRRLRLSNACLSSDDEAGGLQTGWYGLSAERLREIAGTDGKPPWEHRHLGWLTRERSLAVSLCERETAHWVFRLVGRLSMPHRVELRRRAEGR
jgi:hypothetical protein